MQGGSTTTIWDLGTSMPIRPFFSAVTGVTGGDTTLFSQDGKFLVSVCRFCGQFSGSLIDLRQHQPQVFVDFTDLNPKMSGGSLALNQNGSMLAWVSGFPAEIMTRDLTPSDWEQQACQILTLSLQACATAPIPAD